MSIITREDCVTALNKYIKAPTCDLAKKILLEGTEDIPNKEQYIEELLISSVITTLGIELAINKICLKHKINSVSKNNQIILFY